jgi:C-terminal processing protease CtpA/Prc
MKRINKIEGVGGNSVVLVLLAILVFISSCREDEITDVAPTPDDETLAINDFIWQNLNEVYLWEDFIPQNIDRKKEFDSKEYFEKLLYKPLDRWSFITEDYEALINSFKGIEESFGHHFKLFRLPDSNDVIGVVKYVIPESPASQAGIKRGDIFYKVNGTTLDVNNYRSLLFESSSYTLTFGEYNAVGEIRPLEDKQLAAVILTENPIHIRQTFDIDGIKIGYLSYNQFIADFNDELVDAMKSFKTDGISELVLDLRYNPGGSINTAILLSSMIAPVQVSENKEIFSRLLWNELISNFWLEEEGEESDNLISRFITPEVSLDLQRVYILISSNSASASELVINCLKPYMDVVLVGDENTSGKYVGSITLRAEDSGYENWAIQPIVLKTANANGESDYAGGFAPDYFVEDDFNAPLGTYEEDMLGRSLELITGMTIGDPARIASSYFPDNVIEIQQDRELKKQILNLDIW